MATYTPQTPDTYISPLQAGTEFEFVSAYTIFPYETSSIKGGTYTYAQEVIDPKNDSHKNTYSLDFGDFGTIRVPDGENVGISLTLLNGVYKVIYKFTYPARKDITSGKTIYETKTATYTFEVIQNRLPLKKWTITDVINRQLEIGEPIRKGETPRFRLNGMRADGTIITEENKKEGEEVGQAALFDTIYAPQFSFTKQTMRECMQDIGRVIHGEFRMRIKKDDQGYYFECYYDMYGSGKVWKWANIRYEERITTNAIESFCSHLDSNVENLINTLNRDSAVIKDPSGRYFKSVRTDRSNVRVTDSNMLIATKYPIYSIEKLECYYNDKTYDLTPYVFESSEYSRLSSYDNNYPDSKLYALRFRQGQKNIDGLNFKRPLATDAETARGPYSIVAIIKQLDPTFTIPETDYPNLAFRVTYIPIYNTRVAQAKPYYKDNLRAAALIINQQSNLVESKYYGEYLKGMVARLGNVEETRTYLLERLAQIPRSGMKFDDDYYISAVAVSFMPNYIICTIALSKDFNRLSQYIGVSSVKRYSEISESQAVERNVLLREYIVIGDMETPDYDTYLHSNMLSLTLFLFESGYSDNGYPVAGNNSVFTCVEAFGQDYQGNDLPAVCLPVISSAFGNSISFSWEYDDNYSAGDQVIQIDKSQNSEGISGFFQQAYRYTDFYGRMYYYNFQIGTNQVGDVSPLEYPKGDFTIDDRYISTRVAGNLSPVTIRKDNREVLKFNYQIDFVTNRKGFIIGSAFAENNLAIRSRIPPKEGLKIYIFDQPLDKFIDHVNGTLGVDISTLPQMDIEIRYISFPSINSHVVLAGVLDSGLFPASGKSWAIITPQTYIEREVEDEKGNTFTEREVQGGDVILAQNVAFEKGDPFPPIYFTPKRDIQDKTVWKKRR